MVKISIIGKTLKKVDSIKELLPKYNLEYSDENPDIVISSGGDGMFLISERVYPGVPKVLLRDSKICNNCPTIDNETILERLASKNYKIREIKKIKAVRSAPNINQNSNQELTRELIGVNDIVIRNFLPTEALRFKYRVNDEEHTEELIGDGVVIATSFGSNKGAYFHSITRARLNSGVGIAFNNTTTHQGNKIHTHDDTIEILITRGQGVLVADNNRDYIYLEKGDKVIVTTHNASANLVEFD
jgi:hypothetical protein